MLAIIGDVILRLHVGYAKLRGGKLGLRQIELRVLPCIEPLLNDADERSSESTLLCDGLLTLLVIVERDECQGGILRDRVPNVLARQLGRFDAGAAQTECNPTERR